MTETQLLSLIVRKISGESSLSEDEWRELEQWAEQSSSNRRLLDRVTNEQELESEMEQWKQFDAAKGYAKWRRDNQKSRIIRISQWSTAAAVVAGIVLTLALHKGNTTLHGRESVLPAFVSHDVQPGGPKAVLTLSNGERLVLEDQKKGKIAEEGSTQVQKLPGGEIAYVPKEKNKKENLYNQISTPPGGQYPVVLADGSKIWLNASSSIRFPAAFTGNMRKVSVTGEAYFEIAPDPERPFHVDVNGIDIEVLGTKFDVNAYMDEPVSKTTLVEGKVKVSKGAVSSTLLPNQQAQLSEGSRLVIAKNVNVDEAIAWKQGYFQFSDADIPTVMRQLARWYNVKIRYEGAISKALLTASISRDNMASVVLSVLQAGGVHCRLEGDTITVTP